LAFACGVPLHESDGWLGSSQEPPCLSHSPVAGRASSAAHGTRRRALPAASPQTRVAIAAARTDRLLHTSRSRPAHISRPYTTPTTIQGAGGAISSSAVQAPAAHARPRTHLELATTRRASAARTTLAHRPPMDSPSEHIVGYSQEVQHARTWCEHIHTKGSTSVHAGLAPSHRNAAQMEWVLLVTRPPAARAARSW